ncbi:TlyA family RNA methyltransferase [Oenococcus oeni]|uniref:TlyA family RNA methyltransferase n=1 Tax=Oenococcus oeni TaxID=1247 RepID=UPI00050FF400|nr:TlyA family RNA methyltransferase [Oenococcus oeni]KGH82029.1 hemolysin A [Oenococcus oeni S14]KGH96854.1 hemolysin A [Oenococcus oeni IOEB_S450]KZD13513.1 RNA binding methyltransferase [Oenococcus oeni]
MNNFPIRLDQYLVEKGLFKSRTQAQRAIKKGVVADTSNKIFNKSSFAVERETLFHLTEPVSDFASRGALKLEKAVEYFHFDLNKQIVIGIGASTSGFTDLSLRKGAKFVYAVDVGHDQLIGRLRQDDRVKNMEGYNFRYAKVADFLNPLSTRAVIDVSFISLKMILPSLYPILSEESEVVALFKPQFEVGKLNVGKKGIVKKTTSVFAAFEKLKLLIDDLGFTLAGFTDSPIKGGDGNHEFLLYLKKGTHKFDSGLLPDSIKDFIFNSYQK